MLMPRLRTEQNSIGLSMGLTQGSRVRSPCWVDGEQWVYWKGEGPGQSKTGGESSWEEGKGGRVARGRWRRGVPPARAQGPPTEGRQPSPGM